MIGLLKKLFCKHKYGNIKSCKIRVPSSGWPDESDPHELIDGKCIQCIKCGYCRGIK